MAAPDPKDVESTLRGHRARPPWHRRFFGSLHARLLAGFLLVTLIPLAGLIAANDRTTRAALTETAYRSLSVGASRAAVSLDAFIEANLTMIAMEAQAPTILDYLALPATERTGEAKERLRTALTAFALRDKVFIHSYALLDKDGKTQLDTAQSSEPDESRRSYYADVMEDNLAHVSPVEFAADDGRAYLYFSSPVRGRLRLTVGVLRVRYDAAVLQRLLVQSSDVLGPGSFAMLFDDQRLLLAHGRLSPTEAGSLLFSRLSAPSPDDLTRLREARRLPERPVPVVDERDLSAGLELVETDRPYFDAALSSYGHTSVAATVTRMSTRPWLVAFVVPQEIFSAPVETQRRPLLTAAIVVLAVVAATATLAARSLSRPISRLTAAAERLADGDLSVDVAVTSGGEIGVLEATMRRMAADIKRLVDDLADRNRALETANGALQGQNELLAAEIEERARTEIVLREQKEAIRALSTPIITVWDGIVALPLIGALDAERASQMMEKLLDRIVNEQASVAILDLTGALRVDTETAVHLLKVVRAAGLLGSRCVVSGVSPEIARGMVELDLDQQSFVSFGTLESALRHAMKVRAAERRSSLT